jgi:hypothetical protein
VGAQMPVTFESPHGLQGWPFSGDYEQLLEIHHTLFAAAGQWVLDHRKA